MFRDWENFYLIVGSGAGALIGVLFVVATLTAGLDENRATRGAQIYISPIVFHFAIVLVVGAVAVVPELPPETVGLILAFCALTGFAYSLRTAIRLFNVILLDAPDWSDKCFYGLAPMIAYIALAGATAAIWLAPTRAAHAIGATMLFLLLIGIRNAWDLATYLVQHRT